MESEVLEQSSPKSHWLEAAATTEIVEIKFNYYPQNAALFSYFNQNECQT